jgi:hypothetical protein
MILCPKGHETTEPDFCSECGARIQSAAAPVAPPDPVAAPAQACPDCHFPRAADSGSFCEVCGYNFTTGAHGGIPITVAPPAPRSWTATVSVDATLRDPASPEPPANAGPFTVDLDKPIHLIGRKSEARAIFPEIPLDCDEAVSHRHALLTRGADGVLVLRDIGSSNGTRLNGKDVQPLTDEPLRDGDQITLGHWTRITVKAVG